MQAPQKPAMASPLMQRITNLDPALMNEHLEFRDELTETLESKNREILRENLNKKCHELVEFYNKMIIEFNQSRTLDATALDVLINKYGELLRQKNEITDLMDKRRIDASLAQRPDLAVNINILTRAYEIAQIAEAIGKLFVPDTTGKYEDIDPKMSAAHKVEVGGGKEIPDTAPFTPGEDAKMMSDFLGGIDDSIEVGGGATTQATDDV